MEQEFDICQTKLLKQFFSFLTLTKMDRLTITQRFKMIETCYKNDHSATAANHALREDYCYASN